MQDKNVKRLWNTNTKKFIKDFAILQTVNSDGNIEHTYFERNSKTLELERLSTCHIEEINCSGLKDKCGKLIYEGDIVKIPNDYDTYGMFAGEKREVYFYEGGFRLKPKWDKNSRGNWLEDTNVFEIIGNIYENPELLENKQ